MIVHLSTSHTGGAGIAARRLHRQLLLNGVKSQFVSIAKPAYNVGKGESRVVRSLRSRIFGGINARFSKKLSGVIYMTLMSVASVKASKLKEFGSPHNTIFHIHNWFNLINLKELRKLLSLGYKVVFTLHDQRLFTGGCHYSLDCSKFEVDCNRCPFLPSQFNFIPKLNLNRANKVFSRYSSQIEIIAPSSWIQKLARTSSLLKNLKIHRVANVHGELKSEGYSREKKHENNRKDKIFIGVASVEKNSFLKGGLILTKVEKLLIQKKVNAEIVYLSDILNSSGTTKTFWSLIDYLLVPSVLDNSPNVIHEAKILGIPVIATKVGGIGELLNLNFDYSVELNENAHNTIVRVIEKILLENPKINTRQIISTYEDCVFKSVEDIKNIYTNLL
jgi:glycosyltransferase involved in cell wall biosynthesis